MDASCLQSRDAGVRAGENGRESDGVLHIGGRHPRALSRPLQRDDLARVPSVRQCFGIRATRELELCVSDCHRRTGGARYDYRRRQRDGYRDLPCDSHWKQYGRGGDQAARCVSLNPSSPTPNSSGSAPGRAASLDREFLRADPGGKQPHYWPALFFSRRSPASSCRVRMRPSSPLPAGLFHRR